MAYAFRCRNCNSLEEAGHAGENDVPRRCRICGAGGHFDANTGLFVQEPENWVVLADLDGKELKSVLDYHAITSDEIERHAPTGPSDPDRVPQVIGVSAFDGIATEDTEGPA